MTALPRGAMGAIGASQRYTRGRPCPICGGHDGARRGRSERCYGYLSSDGLYAHCTREEYAGALAQNARSATYAHRLHGACTCGVTHGPSLAPSSRRSTAQKRRQTPPDARHAASSGGVSEHSPTASAGASEALAASGADRLADRGPSSRRMGRAPEAVYVYTLADGTPAYKVERWRTVDTDTGELGKTFVQKRADATAPDGWRTGLADTPRLPYRLRQLADADATRRVWIVEGEKCADALAGVGELATCNSGGALHWRECADVARATLAGRHVVILPDNDGASKTPATSYVGQRHALDVAASLADVAASVRVLMLPFIPLKGDIADWLAMGHDAGELAALADAAPVYDPERPAIWCVTGDEDWREGAWWTLPDTTPPAPPAPPATAPDGATASEPASEPDAPGELLAAMTRGELRYIGETLASGETPGIYFFASRSPRPICLLSARVDVEAVDASEARARRSQLAVTLHPASPRDGASVGAPIRRTWARDEVTSGEAFDALLGAVELMPSGRAEYDMTWKALMALASRASVTRPTIRRRYVERLGWHDGVWVSVNGAIDASGAHLDAGIVAGAPETWPQRLPLAPDALPERIDADVIRRLLHFWPDAVTRFPYAALGACAAVTHPASGGRLRWELELFGDSDWLKTTFVNWTLRAFYGAGYTYATATQLLERDTTLGRSLTRASLAYHAYLDYDYSQKPGQPRYEAMNEARIASGMATGNDDTGGTKSSRDGRLDTRPDPQGLLIRAGEPNPHLYSVRQGAWSADARMVTYLIRGEASATRAARLAASQWLADNASSLDRLAILYRQWLASLSVEDARAQWNVTRREALALADALAASEDADGETHTRLRMEQLPDMLAGLMLYAAFLDALDADTGAHARVIQGGAALAVELRAALADVARERYRAMRALRLEYTRLQGGVTPEHALATALCDAIREGLASGAYYVTAPDGTSLPGVDGVTLAGLGYGASIFSDGSGASTVTWRPRPQARPLAYVTGDGERLACDRHVLEVLAREASQHDRRISYTTLTGVLERLRAVGAIICSPGRLTHAEWVPDRGTDFTRIAFPIAALWPDTLAGEGGEPEPDTDGEPDTLADTPTDAASSRPYAPDSVTYAPDADAASDRGGLVTWGDEDADAAPYPASWPDEDDTDGEGGELAPVGETLHPASQTSPTLYNPDTLAPDGTPWRDMPLVESGEIV